MSDATLGRSLGGARGTLVPLPFTLPAPSASSGGRPRSWAARPAGVAMYAAALVLVVVNDRFRNVEAAIIRPVAGLVTGGHGSVAAGSIVYFALGTPRAFGLDVTDECTSALLLIPLLVMMGSFAVSTRIALRRQLLALAVGAALIVGVNVLRVCGIAWATWSFGYDPGYTLSHVFVGSAFSLVGFVGAMLTALWVLVRSERVPRGRQPIAPGSAGRDRRPLPGPGVYPAAQRRRPRPGTAMSFDLDLL